MNPLKEGEPKGPCRQTVLGLKLAILLAKRSSKQAVPYLKVAQ